MPLYDYKCTECETIFEKLMNLNDETIPLCPKCQSQKTKKIMSNPSHLKNVMGKTNLDLKLRDRLKRQPRPANGGAMFTNARGQVVG